MTTMTIELKIRPPSSPSVRVPSPREAPCDDAGIVARIAGGDREAFANLVRRYHGQLLRLAFAFVHDRAVAEEVVQDTWVGVLEGIDGFEGRASLKTWIFGILTNRAKTRSAREARSVPFSALSPTDGDANGAVDPKRFNAGGMWQDPPHAWTVQTAEELMRMEEAVKVMEAIVPALSKTQRAVITLRDLESVSAEETCVLLGITMTNQRVLLHRARTKVREALERYFHGVDPC